MDLPSPEKNTEVFVFWFVFAVITSQLVFPFIQALPESGLFPLLVGFILGHFSSSESGCDWGFGLLQPSSMRGGHLGCLRVVLLVDFHGRASGTWVFSLPWRATLSKRMRVLPRENVYFHRQSEGHGQSRLKV